MYSPNESHSFKQRIVIASSLPSPSILGPAGMLASGLLEGAVKVKKRLTSGKDIIIFEANALILYHTETQSQSPGLGI